MVQIVVKSKNIAGPEKDVSTRTKRQERRIWFVCSSKLQVFVLFVFFFFSIQHNLFRPGLQLGIIEAFGTEIHLQLRAVKRWIFQQFTFLTTLC